MTGPDPDAPVYSWADLLVMWEVGRSFGLAEAGELVDLAVAAALERPVGHGGPVLDDTARETVRDLYQRHLLNSGESCDRADPYGDAAEDSPRRVAWADWGGGGADLPGHGGRPGRGVGELPGSVWGDGW